MIGRGDETIRAWGDLFRLPLNRGYNGTLALDHEAGLWVITITPYSWGDTLARSPEGELTPGDIALRLPALKADDTFCLVSARVANWLDVGYVLYPIRVVE